VSRGGGKVETAPLFFALSRERENPRSWVWGFSGSVIATARPREPQLLEPFAFGLLPARGGCGLTAGCRDALSDGEGKYKYTARLGATVPVEPH